LKQDAMTIEHIKTIIAKGEGLTVEFKKSKTSIAQQFV
jgi:hypothetical protein